MRQASKTKNKQGLTPKQKIVFDVIKDFIKENGIAPSYEELTTNR